MVLVPQNAEGFRATVNALRFPDGSKGLRFHTFFLPGDRCVLLLVKKLGRHMPEDAVREELETRASVSKETYSSAEDAVIRKPPKPAP
jgi:hypothetical protein